MSERERREPFWQAPRWLVRALDDGDLKPGEFTLLCYLGLAGFGHKHYGVSTTYDELRRRIGVSDSTMKRYLRCLRDEWKPSLIRWDDHRGSGKPFRILSGQGLTDGATRFRDRTSDEPQSQAGTRDDLTSIEAPDPTPDLTPSVTDLTSDAAQLQAGNAIATHPDIGRDLTRNTRVEKPLGNEELEVETTFVARDDGERLLVLVPGRASGLSRCVVLVRPNDTHFN